jgi:uncharacterized protein YjbI with pentapeptide repeats
LPTFGSTHGIEISRNALTFRLLCFEIEAWQGMVCVSWFGVAWHWYSDNATVINPIGAFVGAVAAFITAAALAWAGVQNARTAARRHEEQTKADRERRITESFSKATEQLASEKIEVRLGGIYTFERISRESPDDYWVVMETLTAFVREHARWKEPDKIASETLVSLYEDESSEALRPEPATDIAAALTVIARRHDLNRDRERLDFGGSDLRGAKLDHAHLEGAYLRETHLEGAHLWDAHLEVAWLLNAHLQGANLVEAHLEKACLDEADLERASLAAAKLEGASLVNAHLERASLVEAHLAGAILIRAHLEGAVLVAAQLEGADLREAHLEGACFGLEGSTVQGANLEGANLEGAHLEGADLGMAKGLVQDQITQASGNCETTLPQGLTRPEHWPQHGVCAGGTSLS